MSRVTALLVAVLLVSVASESYAEERPKTVEFAFAAENGWGVSDDRRFRRGPAFSVPVLELRYFGRLGHGFVTSHALVLYSIDDGGGGGGAGYLGYAGYGYQIVLTPRTKKNWIDATIHAGVAGGKINWFAEDDVAGSSGLVGPRVGVDLNVHVKRFLAGIGVVYTGAFAPGSRKVTGLHLFALHLRIGGSFDVGRHP